MKTMILMCKETWMKSAIVSNKPDCVYYSIKTVGVLILFLLLGTMKAETQELIGFAGMNKLEQNGTIGGAGGYVVTVSTVDDFFKHIRSADKTIIQVDDTLEFTGMQNVASNKTIVGVDSNGVILGGGLNFSHASNVIIQNLLFQNSSVDAINIEDESHHIWVDHCDFKNAFDGLLDIKTGSDYITVSWNKFSNHVKTCLLGHDDTNAAQDSGRLHVTYHHNWFNKTESRHPRVRFSALCHVFNNYYLGNGYGVASTMDAEVLVEGNYFKNVGSPTHVGYVMSLDGDLVERHNVFDICFRPPEVGGEVPEPPYTYTLDPADSIPNIVVKGAGRDGFDYQPYTASKWMVYEGSILPMEASSFHADNVINPPDTVCWIVDEDEFGENQLLMFINTLKENSKVMYAYDFDIHPSKGATVVFRIKPLNSLLYDRVCEFEFFDGHVYEQFCINPNGEILLNQAGISHTIAYRIGDWHTYRITFQNGQSQVYVDEDPTPVLSGLSASQNSNQGMRFGDGSMDETCGFLLDWLICDSTGAYSPDEQVIPQVLRVDSPPVQSNWQVYDASVLPPLSDPLFVKTNTKNPPENTSWIVDDPEIKDNYLLQFINANEENSKFMWGNEWAMSHGQGSTFAFRIKPIDIQIYERSFEVEVRDGVCRERLIIQSDGIIKLDKAGEKRALPSRIHGWHTYRVTYQSGDVHLYLDETTNPFLEGTSSVETSQNDIRFGDGSDSETHGFYLDWLIFDVTGAYAPGESVIPDSLQVDQADPTSIKDMTDVIPGDYSLQQNFPNPCNPYTTFSYSIPKRCHVSLKILNLQGQTIMKMINEIRDAGEHRIRFDVSGLDSGLYLYQLKADQYGFTRKMMVIK